MFFPVEFVKPKDYDIVSPIVNFIGNSTIVAGVGLVSYLALRALGFSNIVPCITTAIPVTMGTMGAIGAIGGVCVLAAICIAIAKAFGRR